MRFQSHRRTTTVAMTTLAGLAIALSGCESTSLNSSLISSSDRYAIVDGKKIDVPNIDMGKKRSIRAIIDQGKNHSEVMDILRVYAVENGPRLTGSSNLEAAQRWARNSLADWGLSNARLHKYSTLETRFDRRASTGKVFLTPQDPEADPKELRSMEFSTLSWTIGTDGPDSGNVASLPTTMSEYESNRGSYEGAWVMINPNYSGKRGIRSTGFMMRDRMDQRHELRQGSHQDDQPIDAEVVVGVEWKGSFDYNGSKIPATLVIDETGDGIEGHMSIDGFAEGAISEAIRDGDTLTFDWTHSMGTSHITINFEDEKATGTSVSATSGNEYAVDFLRADSQAISDEELANQDKIDALKAVLAENPAGFISSSKDERVWTTSSNGWSTRAIEDYPTDIEVNVRQSDFDFITARLSEGIDIQVEFDLDHELTAGPIPMYNVIAEIPGTEFPDEVIVISAHIDSWDGPGSLGAVDNGTGSAVVTEAARILMASGAKPKRTIRVALWSGEEQGLLGSKGYVNSLSETELANISAVFVDDGGTNYEGGIPAADFMVEYLAAASADTNGLFFSETDYDTAMNDDDPENDELAGYMNVNIRPTGGKIETHGGSDHASFNAKGIPGFFWDETGRANYRHAWHTQNDKFDQAIEEYLIQSATNMALVAYNLANAPELLPRDGEVSTDEASIERNLPPIGSIYDHSHD